MSDEERSSSRGESVPPRPTGVWGMTPREVDAELKKFYRRYPDQRESPPTPRIVIAGLIVIVGGSIAAFIWVAIAWIVSGG